MSVCASKARWIIWKRTSIKWRRKLKYYLLVNFNEIFSIPLLSSLCSAAMHSNNRREFKNSKKHNFSLAPPIPHLLICGLQWWQCSITKFLSWGSRMPGWCRQGWKAGVGAGRLRQESSPLPSSSSPSLPTRIICQFPLLAKLGWHTCPRLFSARQVLCNPLSPNLKLG